MADIHIINDTLVVSIRGIRRLGTFKKELNIPLSQVRGGPRWTRRSPPRSPA